MYKCLIFFLLSSYTVVAQIPVLNPDTIISVDLEKVNSLPVGLKESSGLIALNDSVLITHNDSGNGAYLYFLSTNGDVIRNMKVSNAVNYDWEDISQDDNYIYIGDIGNNSNKRKSLQVYKISKKNILEKEKATATKIEFLYEDQRLFPPPKEAFYFDAESIISLNDSLYIFSKNHTEPYDGLLTVYCLSNTPGNYTAKVHQQVIIESNKWLNNNITASAISFDHKRIALLTHNKIWLLQDFRGTDFLSGTVILIHLNTISQKEAIAFSPDGSLFITDEYLNPLIGGNIYKISSMLLDNLSNKEN